MADTSLAGKITSKAITGLKWATGIAVIGGYVYLTGDHLLKERTAPDCPEALASGFATAALGHPVKHSLMTLDDGTLCQMTFTSPSPAP